MFSGFTKYILMYPNSLSTMPTIYACLLEELKMGSRCWEDSKIFEWHPKSLSAMSTVCMFSVCMFFREIENGIKMFKGLKSMLFGGIGNGIKMFRKLQNL